jgi:hypothetical protein
MEIKIKIITLNGVFFDSENISKEIKKTLSPPISSNTNTKEEKKAPVLNVSSVMAKGILAMDTPSLSKAIDDLKVQINTLKKQDKKSDGSFDVSSIFKDEIPNFSQLHRFDFLPELISNKEEEIKYYFEILPEHQNFIAKISDKSYILIFDDEYLSELEKNVKEKRSLLNPRLMFYTNNGGIIRVNTVNDEDNKFMHTEVVFTLRDVEQKQLT